MILFDIRKNHNGRCLWSRNVFVDGCKFYKTWKLGAHHKHNAKVMTKLKETNEELEENEVHGAKEKISKDYNLIKQRQKLMKQADPSP